MKEPSRRAILVKRWIRCNNYLQVEDATGRYYILNRTIFPETHRTRPLSAALAETYLPYRLRQLFPPNTLVVIEHNGAGWAPVEEYRG